MQVCKKAVLATSKFEINIIGNDHAEFELTEGLRAIHISSKKYIFPQI